MNTKKYLFFILAGLTLCWKTTAQDTLRNDFDIENFIQNLVQFQDDDVNYEDLYESLFQLYLEPVSLNTATRSELQNMYILSELQINNFLEYREKNGKLLSMLELQAVPGFNKVIIDKLTPFVTIKDRGIGVDNRSLLKRIFSETNNYLLLRYTRVLQEKKGFTASESGAQRYLGSPDRVYARFRVSHAGDFSVGFTVEKDEGEQFGWDPSTNRYLFDYNSFHFFVENKGNLKALVVGDYRLQLGQSLLLAAGFNIGKGSETVLTARRNSIGIRPYTSVLEYDFFRGAAATYGIGKFDVTAFYSFRKLDAVLRKPDTTEEEFEGDFISSIQATGFHRTPNEILAKSNIDEHVVGTNVLYRSTNNRLEAGATFLNTHFGSPIVPTQSDHTQFVFSGNNNWNVGAFFDYNWQNFSFFGEVARSQSGGMGGIGGLVASLSPKVDMSVVYRNYGRDLHTFYGNAFGEATVSRGAKNINERGIYWGIKYKPTQKWLIAAYFDKFKFPWLRSGVDAPSSGYEYLGRVTYQPVRGVTFYAQYREEMRQVNKPNNETPVDFLTDRLRRNYVINMDHNLNKHIGFKSRVQFSSFRLDGVTTHGYALIQDVNLDLGKFRFSTRFALFDTDDFNNRQYAYEKDVLYSFSFPAYSGKGNRFYAMIRYKAARKLDFWVRYAITHFRDRDVISSGLEEIQGDVRSDVRLQVRYKL